MNVIMDNVSDGVEGV